MTKSLSIRLREIAEEIDAAERDRRDGWIEWRGGVRPFEGMVEVRLRHGFIMPATATNLLNWAHCGNNPYEIVAYRPIAPNDGDRPQSWALLCDTLKRQEAEIEKLRAALIGEQVTSDGLRGTVDELKAQRDKFNSLAISRDRDIDQLRAQLTNANSLAGSRGRENEQLREEVDLLRGQLEATEELTKKWEQFAGGQRRKLMALDATGRQCKCGCGIAPDAGL